jgi:hypothetical protein
MRIRHLIAVLLVLGLGATGAMAANWTVYPTLETNTTGTTNYASKADGEALVYGGLAAGTTRMQTGYFKFDVSSITDGTTVTAVQFNFYVNATNWPYWSVTPVSLDPVPIFSTAAALWDDAQAEKLAGYYNQQNEGEDYAPGWKMLVLSGTANADMTAALAQDWFTLGAASRDTDPQYFTEIDGHTGQQPYLVVYDDPPPANDTCAGAIVVPGTPGSSSYTGDTTTATNAYDCSALCVGGLPHPGGDVAYTVTLPANCTICVTLNQSVMTWNGAVYMVTDCADVDGTCVAGASGWHAGTLDETFCYSDTATQTYYIIVDGRTGGGAGTFQLDVNVSCLAAPSDLVCVADGTTASLNWVNNDTYDNVVVYQDDVAVATLGGSATSIIVDPVDKGYHCYYVCGVVGTDSSCSDDCCLIQGYDNEDLLWDFEADDGGFIFDGTGGWQWGAPTYGPCFDTADGNVWATDLDADYVNDACWLLDSGAIDLGDKGGFVCFDHCYDIEAGFDGGVVWFTTDDFWYYNFEPIGGTDGVITAAPACTWVAGRAGFTGNSGGWVTDCWDFTDPMWVDSDVKIRFAFGSDSSVVYSGWMIDNVTVYNNVLSGPIDCDYTITPLVGTVPFGTTHRPALINVLTGGAVYTRRIAARLTVTLANGNFYNPWRAGYTNVAPGDTLVRQFGVQIPALASVIGDNTFVLIAADVTPAPFNQPPYPPAGTTCTKTQVLVANAP